jgi:hypothetical protein
MCAERVYLLPSTDSSATSVPDISLLINEWLADLSKKQQTEAEHLLNKLRKSELRWNEDGQILYPNAEETPGSHVTRILDWIMKRQIKVKPIDIDLFMKYLKKNNVSTLELTGINVNFPDNWIRLYE